MLVNIFGPTSVHQHYWSVYISLACVQATCSFLLQLDSCSKASFCPIINHLIAYSMQIAYAQMC